jgi:hypothetical protein
MDVVPMFLKTLLASAAMIVVGWWVGTLFHIGPHRFSLKIVLPQFLAICAVSCIVFAIIAKILRIEEFDEIVGMALKRLKLSRH